MRQYHLTMDGERVPVNPDCGINGCERAEYRAGLCRRHYQLRPAIDRYAASVAAMRGAHEAGKAYRASVVAEVQAIIDGGGA